MSWIAIYGIGLLTIFSLMVLLWLISLRLRNASIVDVFWGAGFVVAAWLYFALSPEGYIVRKLLAAGLVTIWGMRLTLHILRRNWGKPEDFRYQKWRREAGDTWWWRSLFKVFLLQGLLMGIISAPLLAVQVFSAPDYLTIFDYLGLALWALGFFFEAVGDCQLSRFKALPENKGKTMDRGLWRYTRHPNYFGDATQWWGYYMLSLAAGGWWSIFSPLLMTFMLRRVSGVALLEKTMVTRPGYIEYVARTNAFIPWFPRRGKDE
ncbi:MAG: DUF1295 domain-containing protein [Chloroflexi bacterium]|nr:DUF1295 domain-containing protein [Chloroflexota bacterium]